MDNLYEGNTYPIRIEDLEKFEEKYNLNLPKEYCDFLLEHNGGSPVLRRFKAKKVRMKSSFKFIIPLIKDQKNNEFKHDLEYYYNEFVIKQKMPNKYFPFGEDPRENILCLSINGDDYGSVYFWDKEAELVDNLPQAECYHIIADNFNEFINGLREKDDQFT